MRVTMMVRCLAMMRGGGETRHLAWTRELATLGVDVDVITGRPLLIGGARHPVAGTGVTVLRTPYLRDLVYRWQRRRGFGRATAWALHLDEEWFTRAAWQRVAARRPLPDVVHAHALHQTARLRRSGLPVVINLPGAPHARYLDDLRQADALIGDGWAAAELPSRLGCPVDDVPKGVDTARFTPDGADLRAALQLGEAPVVLGVGRLVPIKNLRLLIEALPAVRARVPGVRLLLVGDGPEHAALAARAAALQVADAVVFAGYVSHDTIVQAYRAADVFALTSEFDNSPNVVLEAMSTGRPVVATDVGGVGAYVEQGAGGTLVPRGDRDALAEALCRWLLSPDARDRARRHNRWTAERRYSWRASAERLVAVYERVLRTRVQRATA